MNTCDICNKQYSNKSNLVKHQRIHSGEKPYSCDQCEKSFVRKDHLTKHRMIHTGEKLFSCDKHYASSSASSNHNKSSKHFNLMKINSNAAPTPFFNCGEVIKEEIKEEEILEEDPLSIEI